MTRTIDNVLLGTTKEPAADLYKIWMPRIDRAVFVMVFILALALLIGIHAYIAAHPTSAEQSIEWGVR